MSLPGVTETLRPRRGDTGSHEQAQKARRLRLSPDHLKQNEALWIN